MDLGGGFDVDVLVIGGGIQGLYVASALRSTYSVAIVSDPSIPPETLDSAGLVSAGYDGNDPNRIQPARRAAGYWRMWADRNGVEHAAGPTVYLVPPHEALSRPRLWDDAMLDYREADAVPELFDGGSLADGTSYLLHDDLVVNPRVLCDVMRTDLEDCWIEGRMVRCELVDDRYVDHVEIDVGDGTLSIGTRSLVLAAGAANTEILGMVAKRFADSDRRREAQQTARDTQAIQLVPVVCARGEGLPELSGWFGDLSIVSHRFGESDDIVWLVSLPPADAHTTLGAQDLRFTPPVDGVAVRAILERLMAIAPGLVELRSSLRWSTWTSRRTQHPSLAVEDSSSIARPVPAKLETLGLDAVFALWPSQLSYSMVLGDVVVERLAEALGESADLASPQAVSKFAIPPTQMSARWERDDVEWQDWEHFSTVD